MRSCLCIGACSQVIISPREIVYYYVDIHDGPFVVTCTSDVILWTRFCFCHVSWFYSEHERRRKRKYGSGIATDDKHQAWP